MSLNNEFLNRFSLRLSISSKFIFFLSCKIISHSAQNPFFFFFGQPCKPVIVWIVIAICSVCITPNIRQCLPAKNQKAHH